MVILSDFIRREFIDNENNEYENINKIGVVPIFETLRRNNLSGVKLGALTGSLVIIPASAANEFNIRCSKLGGYDVSTLCRRFKAFVGVCNDNRNIITNGIDRLGLPCVFEPTALKEFNAKTINIATNRQLLKEKWNSGLKQGGKV